MLCEAAWIVVRYPSPLRAFGERIRARRGAGIATVAVARKLVVLFWHLAERWGRVPSVEVARFTVPGSVAATAPTVDVALSAYESGDFWVVANGTCAGTGQVHGQRWHDNNRLRILIKTLDRFPQRHEFLLQPIELILRIRSRF